MTYGVLPTESAFRAAFADECPKGFFQFGNDERVGNASLTASELWEELTRAQLEWEEDAQGVFGDSAGMWCSDVLSCLGFEWI